MEILNENGKQLIEFRNNFKRHYSESVNQSLQKTVHDLYENNQIPEKILRNIFNEDIDDIEFQTCLLSFKKFKKSPTQLSSEYDKIRETVNQHLVSIGFTNNISTKNLVQFRRIAVIRQYDVPIEVLLSYFGLNSIEAQPLMKRKGFMDKFCCLRLNQIFKEIYSDLKTGEYIDKGYTPVYYNKRIKGFSIDFKYMVNIDYISDEHNMVQVIKQIQDLDKYVEKQFQNKLNFSFFSPKKEALKAKVEAPSLPPRIIKEPILEEIKSQPAAEDEIEINEIEIPQNINIDESIKVEETIMQIEEEDKNLL